MLYMFKQQFVSKNQTYVHAQPVDGPVTTAPHWFDDAPISLIPPHPTYQLNTQCVGVDLLPTGDIKSLYSEALIDVLAAFDVRFEIFPVTLLDRAGKEASKRYALFHLLEVQSPVARRVPDAHGVMQLLPMSQRFAADAPSIFRPATHANLIFVTPSVKEAIETRGLSGCAFEAVDDHFAPRSFNPR
ncbi:hypothetical protein [Deinococcus humi]|uniref:Uncharacterized protein n=1 Tax=Deinococcus humi TaxID=662880 RepID=A0A7W8NH60_9DEIO|nr:hypothetical protein [Deinococcus humi]MBB5363662.1 hypothetical protein [Deinococcus humi]GGO29869.1 hypothetical protein GCM10008949_23950 [Deinococcus humi]